MFAVGLWLVVCAVWGKVAWLLGASVAVGTLPYWGVPLALFSYLIALEVLDAVDARLRKRRDMS